MVKLEKLSRDELDSKPFLINQIIDLYGEVPGDFYKYSYKGEERWLYRDNLYCTILGIDGEYLVYTSFMINEDYDVFYMEFDDFYVARNNIGEMMLWKEGSRVAESLTMQKRSENASVDDLDGLITHHQINSSTKDELLISYKGLYRDELEFYQSQFIKPFIYSFISNGKVRQYMQFTTSPDYLSYDLITIREFGLLEFLRKGSYALQKDSHITRYFKVRAQKADGTCILLYPFFRGFTKDEMDGMIEEKGFSRKVTDNVLDYYNGNYLECAEYEDLAVAMKEYDLSHNETKKLEKKVDDNNGNS